MCLHAKQKNGRLHTTDIVSCVSPACGIAAWLVGFVSYSSRTSDPRKKSMLAGGLAGSHEQRTANEMRIEARAGVALGGAGSAFAPLPSSAAGSRVLAAANSAVVAEVAEVEAVELGAEAMGQAVAAVAFPCTTSAVSSSRKRKADNNNNEPTSRGVGRGAASCVVSTDEALARLEEEVAAMDPDCRIPATLVLAASWDERWKAGSWVGKRKSQGAKATSLRQKMTPVQLERLEALPYGVGRRVSTDEALDRLEEEAAAKGPTWRVTQKLVLQASWDDTWKAGVWVMHRTGQAAQAVASRAKMTPAQRSRFEALPRSLAERGVR